MTKRAPPFATFNEGGNQNLITNETPQIGELKDFHLIASEADYSGTFTGLLLQCKFSVEENSQDDPRVSAIRFLVACYGTLHPLCRSVRPSVGPSIHHTLLFWRKWGFWPYCSCPNVPLTSIMAPAHPHATLGATFGHLFLQNMICMVPPSPCSLVKYKSCSGKERRNRYIHTCLGHQGSAPWVCRSGSSCRWTPCTRYCFLPANLIKKASWFVDWSNCNPFTSDKNH